MKKIMSFFIGVLGGITVLTISVAATGQVIKVVKNSCNLEVNNNRIDTERILFNDRLYIPLRSVSEKMGSIVEWDEGKKEVRIFNEYYDENIPTPKEDFVYKGIKVKMDKSQVEAILGKPIKIIQGEEGMIIRYSYVYDSCIIGFDEFEGKKDIVWSIKITDKQYKTAKGIGLGDKKINLIRKYGKPRWGEVENNYDYLCYESDQDMNDGIQFNFDEAGMITNIEVYMAGMG